MPMWRRGEARDAAEKLHQGVVPFARFVARHPQIEDTHNATAVSVRDMQAGSVPPSVQQSFHRARAPTHPQALARAA